MSLTLTAMSLSLSRSFMVSSSRLLLVYWRWICTISSLNGFLLNCEMRRDGLQKRRSLCADEDEAVDRKGADSDDSDDSCEDSGDCSRCSGLTLDTRLSCCALYTLSSSRTVRSTSSMSSGC